MQPQTQVPSTTSSLDQDAVNLAKAIRQTESGGNFTAKGKSGEFGAYQYTKPTWQQDASAYLEKPIPLEQATPEQQNEVAYKKIKSLKDKGYNVGQIASIWNSGKPDAYLDSSYTGTNSSGAKYDVPAYAKSVATAYQTIKGGGQVTTDPNNPSSVPQFPLTTQKDIQNPTADNYHTGTLGTNPGDSTYGKLIDNDITRGIMSVFPGAKLGNAIGNSVSGLVQGVKTGSLAPIAEAGNENNKNISGIIGDTVKSVATPTAILAGGEALKGISSYLGKGSTLAKPVIKTILESAIGPGETISNLSRQEAINTLGNYLKEMSVSESGGKTEQLILQALKELNPTLIEKQNLLAKLVKGGLSLAGQTALFNALGSKLGGLVHGVITK